ncbi:MAG: hypothetical protein ABJ370_21120 [Paracoccaceae bacterium]
MEADDRREGRRKCADGSVENLFVLKFLFRQDDENQCEGETHDNDYRP